MKKECIKIDKYTGGINKLIISYYNGNQVDVYIEDYLGHFAAISIDINTELGLCLTEYMKAGK